ncbi:hypothetical protein K7432_005894 [Basidiobolus ranarum]|uniref:PUM-HD domain-containing protein n=1 Tax=Basidiobolus ranarum TaxID=34480 RepID=A0ABR2W2Z2_9FUNG
MLKEHATHESTRPSQSSYKENSNTLKTSIGSEEPLLNVEYQQEETKFTHVQRPNNISVDLIRDGSFVPSEHFFHTPPCHPHGNIFDSPIEEVSQQSYFDFPRLPKDSPQFPPPKTVFLDHRHRANTMPSTFKLDYSEEYSSLSHRHNIDPQGNEALTHLRTNNRGQSLYKRFPSEDANIWQSFDELRIEDMNNQRSSEKPLFLDESNIQYNKASRDTHSNHDYLSEHLSSVFDSDFIPQGTPYTRQNFLNHKEIDTFPPVLSATSPRLDTPSFTALKQPLTGTERNHPNQWTPFVATSRAKNGSTEGNTNSYNNLVSTPGSAGGQKFFTTEISPDLFSPHVAYDSHDGGYTMNPNRIPVLSEHHGHHPFYQQGIEMCNQADSPHEGKLKHLKPKQVHNGGYHEGHFKSSNSGNSGNLRSSNHHHGHHHSKANHGTTKNAGSKTSTNKINPKKAVSEVESMNRFLGVSLESLVGEIYALCRDQHGCRYLQKKLEEQNPAYIDIIFEEVSEYFVDLMTDPFGNYLCQKLLEYSNDEQRTVLVGKVAPELVRISLNMHGTRAAQKLVEYLSNAKQIQLATIALTPSVVPLIKDLNGNHVIQKCLSYLAAKDNQFIYDAVTRQCVEVATHRHGCCVFQRCIDHASPAQKAQLVDEITVQGLRLVQDPFGNYVVQYILDLGEDHFSNSLIRTFWGSVCVLSIQKFSSNVIEKCIRVADNETRRGLIKELLNPEQLEKLLRDSFANYVVQTALDYADPVQRSLLAECIKPMIPFIKNTPYGKRIQGKLSKEQAQHPVMFLNTAPQPSVPMGNLQYKDIRPEYKHATMSTMRVNNIRFPFY